MKLSSSPTSYKFLHRFRFFPSSSKLKPAQIIPNCTGLGLGYYIYHCVLISSDMKNRRHHQKSEKGIKVTYISSPMKLKTSTSNFRALVQKLTGKYSNVAEANFMEEARHENDDDYYELIVKGSSSSSLELEQQWWVVGPDEPAEEEEEEAALAWLKLQDYSTNSMVDPEFNDQLLWEFLGFEGF